MVDVVVEALREYGSKLPPVDDMTPTQRAGYEALRKLARRAVKYKHPGATSLDLLVPVVDLLVVPEDPLLGGRGVGPRRGPVALRVGAAGGPLGPGLGVRVVGHDLRLLKT